MLHTEIENNEVIERYVRNRLAPEEQRAFEEHFFSCDECFGKVQDMERFVAGVRDAAERGTLTGSAENAAAAITAKWLPWGFAASTCTIVGLAIAVGWLTLSTLPKIRSSLAATAARVQSQQEIIARLRQQSLGPQNAPEANVALVMLQTSRGDEAAEAVLPDGSKHLVLWVEMGPARFTSYRMEVLSQSGKPVLALENLVRGPYGAIAVSLPASQLQPGVFRITLTGQAPPPVSLVGEYRLRIRKP